MIQLESSLQKSLDDEYFSKLLSTFLSGSHTRAYFARRGAWPLGKKPTARGATLTSATNYERI